MKVAWFELDDQRMIKKLRSRPVIGKTIFPVKLKDEDILGMQKEELEKHVVGLFFKEIGFSYRIEEVEDETI